MLPPTAHGHPCSAVCPYGATMEPVQTTLLLTCAWERSSVRLHAHACPPRIRRPCALRRRRMQACGRRRRCCCRRCCAQRAAVWPVVRRSALKRGRGEGARSSSATEQAGPKGPATGMSVHGVCACGRLTAWEKTCRRACAVVHGPHAVPTR
eukprot:360766-Chlamydomonas_euryale.AAC.14